MPGSRWRAALALISIGLIVGACARVEATPGTSPGASPAGAALASATDRGSPGPSRAGSQSPATSPSPSPAGTPSPAEPPGASLAVDGGEPVEGQLGTFTWQNAGSDAPWLDGNAIRVGAGERLTLSFVDPIGVANWTASRVPPGNRDGSGAIGMGEGSAGPVAFDAPPRGSWSMNVDVWFSDNLGSASYYWLVDVE